MEYQAVEQTEVTMELRFHITWETVGGKKVRRTTIQQLHLSNTRGKVWVDIPVVDETVQG